MSLQQIVFSVRPNNENIPLEKIVSRIHTVEEKGLKWRKYPSIHSNYIGYGIREILVVASIDKSILSPGKIVQRMLEFEDILSAAKIVLLHLPL